MIKRGIAACMLVLAAASVARAFDPTSLPEASKSTYEDILAPGSLTLPVGVYAGSLPQLDLEGQLTRSAWQIPAPNLSTLELVRGLRKDLARGAYTVLLDCDTDDCGGFDFRFGLPVLPAPEMNVDLFDFRVLVAQRVAAGRDEFVYALVSRGRTNRFVQIFEMITDRPPQAVRRPVPSATPAADQEPAEVLQREVEDMRATAPGLPEPTPSADPIATLQTSGYFVLTDLDFPSGAETLTDRRYASLAALAAFLKENAGRIIALVGHTDAVGSLEANTALSRRRAEAVRRRLIDIHGADPAQVTAHGAGYLAPLASNLSAPGREMNRRVEAVLLGAE